MLDHLLRVLRPPHPLNTRNFFGQLDCCTNLTPLSTVSLNIQQVGKEMLEGKVETYAVHFFLLAVNQTKTNYRDIPCLQLAVKVLVERLALSLNDDPIDPIVDPFGVEHEAVDVEENALRS